MPNASIINGRAEGADMAGWSKSALGGGNSKSAPAPFFDADLVSDGVNLFRIGGRIKSCYRVFRKRFFSRSQAVLGNAHYYRQAKLGTHFRSQVQLGNELKINANGGMRFAFPPYGATALPWADTWVRPYRR